MAKKKHNKTLLGVVLWVFGLTFFTQLPGYFADYLVFFVMILVFLTLAIIKST